MKLHRGPGLLLFLALCLGGAGYTLASRLGYLDRLQARFFPAAKEAIRLSPGGCRPPWRMWPRCRCGRC